MTHWLIKADKYPLAELLILNSCQLCFVVVKQLCEILEKVIT